MATARTYEADVGPLHVSVRKSGVAHRGRPGPDDEPWYWYRVEVSEPSRKPFIVYYSTYGDDTEGLTEAEVELFLKPLEGFLWDEQEWAQEMEDDYGMKHEETEEAIPKLRRRAHLLRRVLEAPPSERKDWTPRGPELGVRERGKKWYPRGERFVVVFHDRARGAIKVDAHGRAEAHEIARDGIIDEVTDSIAEAEGHENRDERDYEDLVEIRDTITNPDTKPGDFDDALERWGYLVNSGYGDTPVEIY